MVADIKWRLRGRAPELLADVRFSHRPPLPPYSEQIDDFFRDAGISETLGAVHPAYKVFTLLAATKARIRAQREEKLAAYLDAIREISSGLEQLAVTNPYEH